MQVINLNLPTDNTTVNNNQITSTNQIPGAQVTTNNQSGVPSLGSESMSVTLNDMDLCDKGTECNELIYSMGSVLSIGQVPDCKSPTQSFQRSLTQATEKRIPGGKSNTINLDLGPGEVKTINPSSVGLNGLALVQIKATCGDVLVSFDCENWFRVKQFILDSSSSVDCAGNQANISEIYVKNYFPPEGLTTCDGKKLKRARVEMILVGS